MESTLQVAQRAVEADVNKNYPLAVALYRQARLLPAFECLAFFSLCELISHCLSSYLVRRRPSLTRSWPRARVADHRRNKMVRRDLVLAPAPALDSTADIAQSRSRATRAAIRAKAAEYRARGNALQGLVRTNAYILPQTDSLVHVAQSTSSPLPCPQAAASQMATLSQVAQQATTAHAEGQQAVRNAGGMQTMAGAAAIGAAAGMIVAGPIVGLVAAGAAAYAATRTDAVGDATRTAGQGIVNLTKKVDEINQEHKLTGEASRHALAAFGD